MTRRLLLPLTVALVLLVAACGSDGEGRTDTKGPGSTSSTSAAEGPIGKGSNGFEGSDGTSSGSAGDPGDPGDPDAPVSNEPGGEVPTEPGRPREVPNRTDLVDPRAIGPDAVTLTVDPDDDRTVHVAFYGGVTECYGAEASATETAEAVVVTLRTGSLPDAAGQACIDLAEHQQVTLTLDAPVGDRTLEVAPAP